MQTDCTTIHGQKVSYGLQIRTPINQFYIAAVVWSEWTWQPVCSATSLTSTMQ